MDFSKISALLKAAAWHGWEPVRMIGKGSYGTVYKIEKHHNNGTVEHQALKVISIPEEGAALPMGQNAEALRARYSSVADTMEQEYETMRTLMNSGCKNVVWCYGYKRVPDEDGIGLKLLIRMELLTDLNTYVRRCGISRQAVVQLGIDVCRALEACRVAHVFHRDIKPANLFISKDGVYKLGDFGVAKRLEETGYAGSKQGTILYMAPEVYKNQDYDGRADMYSLGLVMYQMMNNGQMPFMGGRFDDKAQGEALARRMRGERLPMPIAESGTLAKAVCCACEPDYHNRFHGPTQMRMVLERLLDPGDRQMYLMPMDEPEMKYSGIVIPQEKHMDPEESKTIPVNRAPNYLVKKEGQSEDETMPMGYRGGFRGEIVAAAEDGKRKKKWPIAVIGTMALLLAMLVGLAVWSPWEANTEKETEATVETEPKLEEEKKTEPELEESVVSGQWSQWEDRLPDEVSAHSPNYEIEEKTLYRSRKRETTTSTDPSMAGWSLYDTKQGDGSFGPLSEWSPTAVTLTSERNVETETRYRYRDKETTSSTSSSLAGWELYDQKDTMGDYGGWSSWSETKVSSSDTRKVETKTQYQYRDITTSKGYTDWSGWSDWQDGYISEDDLTKVETRTVYEYLYNPCPSCGNHWHGQDMPCFTWGGGCGRSNIGSNWVSVWGTIPQSQIDWKDWHGTTHWYTEYNGERVFRNKFGDNSKTQYRYATRSAKEEKVYGEWSSWSDSPCSKSASREVNTRTMYRYCDREEVTTYYFYRWGSWSNYTGTPASFSDSRQVETKTYYRYQDKIYDTVYYHYRWSDWSDWTDREISKTEDLDVETKTMYRYRGK